MELVQAVFVNLLVISVMLAAGLDLTLRQVSVVLRRPALMASGLTFNHVVMPALAFALCRLFELSDTAVLGIMLVVASPGGPVGSLLAQHARGNLGFSVALVVVMTLVNTVSTPATLQSLGIEGVGGPGFFFQVAGKIALTLLLPLGVGMALRARRPTWATWLHRVVAPTAKGVLAVLIVGMLATKGSLVLQIETATFVVAQICCLASLALGYLLSTGTAADRTSLSLNSGVRNMALAFLVAADQFGDDVLFVVMIYGLAMLLWTAGGAVVLERINRDRIPAPVS